MDFLTRDLWKRLKAFLGVKNVKNGVFSQPDVLALQDAWD